MSENYSLERQLQSYQKSISMASNSSQRINLGHHLGHHLGQRAKSDDFLHESSLHYQSNYQMAPHFHTQASSHCRSYEVDRRSVHSVAGEPHPPFESEYS